AHLQTKFVFTRARSFSSRFWFCSPGQHHNQSGSLNSTSTPPGGLCTHVKTIFISWWAEPTRSHYGQLAHLMSHVHNNSGTILQVRYLKASQQLITAPNYRRRT